VIETYSTSLIHKYLNKEGGYYCLPLSEYLSSLTLPTSIGKQEAVLIILIQSGQLNVSAGYNEIKAVKGELVVIQPSKPYAILQASSDIKGTVFYISGEGLIGSMGNHSLIFSLDILETWNESKYSFSKEILPYIGNIFSRIRHEYVQPSGDLTIVNAYTITLLLELKSIHNINTRSNHAAISIVNRYKAAIAVSLSEKLSTSDYAKELSITTNHLNKCVKSITGLSASQLYNKITITEAKYLLLMADLTVTEVAYRLGFDDPSYFSRFFKKHEGLTPLDFRQKLL